jgi:hypothetical protein
VTFTVTLHTHGARAHRRLARTLKTAWRRDRLRCTDVRETTRASRRRTAPVVGTGQARRGDTTMDASRFAGSTFLGLDDVKDGKIKAEIFDVEEGGYKKLVLIFTNGLKFSLNVGNTVEMIKAFGSETEGWRGEHVELYQGEVPYEGKMVPSVRVTPLMRAEGEEKKKLPPSKPKPKGGGGKGGDMDDEIPFEGRSR